MALTHVLRWSEKTGTWKPITIEEACRLYPNETISANSGLFMCSLCRHKVILTKAGINNRYFRHNSADEDKNCKDRSVGVSSSSSSYTFSETKHDLPIHLSFDLYNMHFSIGFYSIPSSLLNDESVKICINDDKEKSYIYSITRLNDQCITYLSVGNVPSTKYKITVASSNGKGNSYYEYWPPIVTGIGENSIFDAKTGKKLPENSDIVTNHIYWFLTKRRMYPFPRQLKYSLKNKNPINGWYIFEICPDLYEQKIARFFAELGYYLTAEPVQIFPIWPVYKESPYFAFYNDTDMYLYASGNEDFRIKTRPSVTITASSNLRKLSCTNDHCLIAAGRGNSVLSYLNLFNSHLKSKPLDPEIKICNIDGQNMEAGEYNILPKEKVVFVKTEFDGFVKIYKDGKLRDKIEIKAGKETQIDVQYQYKIEVYEGLDCLWSASFIHKTIAPDDQDLLLQKLVKAKGHLRSSSHEIAYIYKRLDKYPKVQNWLKIKMRMGNGTISETALSLLKEKVMQKD